MIGAAIREVPPKVAIFQKKDWTAFEQTLRALLVITSQDLGCGVTEYIKALLSGNRYPSFMDSKYKVHACLLAYYSDEVNAFMQLHKDALAKERPEDITNMYFLAVLAKIAADYKIELKKS